MWFALNVSNVKTCRFLLSKGAKVSSWVLSSAFQPHSDADDGTGPLRFAHATSFRRPPSVRA